MLHATRQVNGGILWANLHLLFWLSLIPFVTAWMGEHQYAGITTAAYGIVVLMSAIAFQILAQLLVQHHGEDSLLSRAFGPDLKGWASLALYVAGVGLSFVSPYAALACYALVSAIWLVPDSRIERLVAHETSSH